MARSSIILKEKRALWVMKLIWGDFKMSHITVSSDKVIKALQNRLLECIVFL